VYFIKVDNFSIIDKMLIVINQLKGAADNQ